MKLNSVSGLGFYVKDLDKTAKFYEDLGFRIGKREANNFTCYLNWFSMQFMAQDSETKPEFLQEAHLENRGSGLYINVKVENVDEFYAGVVEKGYKPSSEPRDWPSGN